ncbi:mitochondrial fission ELM1 family protein [Marinobacterium arenosum]|uniref:mitochondrial fission ELM1 family protein n=1 Tax=Marinobacterium arenosum TaxID=2862496 RepID=UPI001C98045D|nr:ELM1/GtrOC1 family putative glycosyltransferase [Marinobacterium arenosum]MBY4676438.1 mitochondrial fission ELM1 family protein [Marinobacterium arenosum]
MAEPNTEQNTEPKKTPLTVWCLSDGRPGHYNQSKGLLQALACGYQLSEHWLEVRLRAKPLRKLMRAGLNSNPALHRHWVEAMYRRELPNQRPELIISTGGNTAFLNAALAEHFGCRNYFIGSLRGLKPELFSLVLTLEPIGAPNNLVMPLAPSPINRSQLAQAGGELTSMLDGPLWTMLIGGATSEYRFQPEDWQNLAEQMNRLAEQRQIRWLVTSSPRTGVEVEQLLAANLKPQALADTVWWGQQPRKVMAAYLGAAERIFCSEDSLSMLTEAVSSGKPVTALSPQDMTPEPRYLAALERLVGRGWLERRAIAELERVNGIAEGQRLEDPLQYLWQLIRSHSESP